MQFFFCGGVDHADSDVAGVEHQQVLRGGPGRAREEQVNETAVGGLRYAPQGDRVLVLDGHFKVIAGRKVKLLADGDGQHDLALL